MRPNPSDARVAKVARDFGEGIGVAPWPDGLNVNGACACLVVISDDEDAFLCYAPGHQCENPDRLRLSAAQVLVNFWDHGPDEGWVPAYQDGSGHVTWLSTPLDAAQRLGTIPVSEMPPLD